MFEGTTIANDLFDYVSQHLFQAVLATAQLIPCLVPRRLSRARKGSGEEDNGLRLPFVLFPWSLAAYHQSLASTLRKTKRLRRRLVQCVTDFSSFPALLIYVLVMFLVKRRLKAA